MTSRGSFGARQLEAEVGLLDSVVRSAGADVLWLSPVPCLVAALALSAVDVSAFVAGGVACLIGSLSFSNDDAG